MPTTVIATAGQDTLCNIAMQAGFFDCAPLRAEPANAAFLTRDLQDGDIVTVPDVVIKEESRAPEQKHRFQLKSAPPVLIRFTHGSPDKPYREDATETVLNVSNIQTDKGGANGQVSFPTLTVFDPNGHVDLDAFKIEIVDPRGGGTVTSTLQALKPVLRSDGTIEKHEPFTGAELAKRKTDVTCKAVPSKVCFRSPYLRLVVDETDKAARSAQTLLTTDMADGTQGDDDKIEILDQLVEASYVLQKCPGGTKCRVFTRLLIGSDHKHVKVAAHILQNALGARIVEPVLLRKRILNYVRQLYAQADVSVRIIEPIDDVPLPANMIAIANANGQRAVGARAIRVRIQIDAAVDVEAAITTVVDALPIDTANAMAAAITAVVPAGTKVVPSDNPPLRGQAIGSADVLVGDPRTQRVRLNILESADARHPVTIGQLTSASVPDFGGSDSHVGTIQERVLVKNYDTGSDRVDLFVVETLGSGALGEAFIPNAAGVAALQPIGTMTNTALVFANTIRINDHFHTTIPHELGHILMDAVHASVATEMMGPGSPEGANERVVKGPKRISDPRRISYDNGIVDVPVNLLRNANTTLLE
ncbi:MAG: hypothetical protein ABIP85_27750 [Chthoniobacteraceae bacterium]